MPVGALSRAAVGAVAGGGVSGEGIWERLANVPDFRSRFGRIYPLPCLAAVWLCSLTAAGHDRVSGVREWLADTTDQERARLRLPWDPLDGYRLPDESTIRRFLKFVDDQGLAVALLDPPLAAEDPPVGEAPEPPAAAEPELPTAQADPAPAASQVVVSGYAVDGKTSRGARREDGSLVHLIGAVSLEDARFVGQVEVDSKTNETTVFRTLLDPLDLVGKVITSDALHTHRANLEWLVSKKKGHYIAVFRGNQPKLLAFLKALAWADIPTGDLTRDHGHGRDETRSLKAATVEHADFPYAQQAIRIQHWRQVKGKPPTRETIYAITDMTFEQAGPQVLADFKRNHWSIEVLHHVRDVTFGEDKSTSRAGHAPAVLALFRGAVINAIRRAGYRYIPAGRRANKTATAALNLHGFP